MALHEQLGPAQTSISAIAELAGVGRPTVYRHFPDEHSLFSACTTHFFGLHPPPDPALWRQIDEPEVRLRCGLLETYRWYRETERMTDVSLRDLPEVPALAKVLRSQLSAFAEARTILADGWLATDAFVARAVIGHVLAFSTWHSLARDFRQSDETVAELMTGLVLAAARHDAAVSA